MKFLKNNMRRILVLIATIVAMLAAISLGSIFYVRNNVRKSIQYAGGAEYLVGVRGDQQQVNSQAVATSIYERINPLGLSTASAEIENGDDGAINIRVQYPGVTTEEEIEDVLRLITRKPQLILTDYYGNPLFDSTGKFNSNLSVGTDPGNFVSGSSISSYYTLPYLYPDTPEERRANDEFALASSVPIQADGATASQRFDGTWQVVVTLASTEATTEWTKATEYISKLQNSQGIYVKKNLFMWLDPQILITKLQTGADPIDIDDYYNNHSRSFVAFAQTGRQDIDKSSYLISQVYMDRKLTEQKFVISGNFTSTKAFATSRNINYGNASYKLTTLFSRQINPTYGKTSFDHALIAGIVVFSLIALILIVNYGLLGALSVMSLAFYFFMTIFIFTVMRGEYSPATIASLILGIGMAVDATIITFERLKARLYAGSTLRHAFGSAAKKTLPPIFDANITTMFIALVLFYMGTRSIIGLSITIVIAIIFTLLIAVLLTRILAYLVIDLKIVKKHKSLLGLKPKFDPRLQKRIDHVNYLKSSRWFLIGPSAFVGVGIIIFTTFAIINKSFGAGINLSQDFAGGISIAVSKSSGLTQAEVSRIITMMTDAGINQSDINVSPQAIEYYAEKSLGDFSELAKNLKDFFRSSDVNVNISTTSTAAARTLIRDSILAILVGFILITIYTSIRLGWTFSFAAIFALLHDALFVIFAFIISRLEVSPVFVAGLLIVVGYSINNTIVTFSHIKEKMVTHVGEFDRAKLLRLSNNAVKAAVKRTIWTSFTTILVILVLMSFGNAISLSFGLTVLLGLIIGAYSSVFVAPKVWCRLETLRQKKIKDRIKKEFWKTTGVEEQLVNGINDFRV